MSGNKDSIKVHLTLELAPWGMATAGNNRQISFLLNTTFKDEAEFSQSKINEFYILKRSLHTHYVEAPQLQAWLNSSLFQWGPNHEQKV